MIKNEKLKELIAKLKNAQNRFKKEFGLSDIVSNSKIFEVLIANTLDHKLIPKLSGARDAVDSDGQEYEYKHYKKTSSNHTWTFNDFTDSTIKKLYLIKAVIFAFIDDTKDLPCFDWYYSVPGKDIGNYLNIETRKIKNNRKMINVGPGQIEGNLKIKKSFVDRDMNFGKYAFYIKEIFKIAQEIEVITNIKQILTSNKFWEMLVSLETGHRIMSEQAGHDAEDEEGNLYEYKVSKTYSWNFQDISNEVLDKYLKDKEIICATVDKSSFKVLDIYRAPSQKIVKLLKKKLKDKKKKFKLKGKTLRRLQVSISKSDIGKIIKS